MKIIIITILFLIPSITLAAPFIKDSYVATDTFATSTFAGNFSVAGNVHFGLADGILSIVNGLLGIVNIQTPLILSNNTLSVTATGSDKEIQFNDEGSLAGDANFTWDKFTDTISMLEGGNGITINGPSGIITGVDNDLNIQTNGINRHILLQSSSGNNITVSGSVGGGVALKPGPGGNAKVTNANSGFSANFITGSLSDNKDYIFPDQSGTFGLLEASQAWSGSNIFSKGTSATTTVTFGEMGDRSSRSCFNTKNTDGDDISFYFVGTAMVVDNSLCR